MLSISETLNKDVNDLVYNVGLWTPWLSIIHLCLLYSKQWRWCCWQQNGLWAIVQICATGRWWFSKVSYQYNHSWRFWVWEQVHNLFLKNYGEINKTGNMQYLSKAWESYQRQNLQQLRSYVLLLVWLIHSCLPRLLLGYCCRITVRLLYDYKDATNQQNISKLLSLSVQSL